MAQKKNQTIELFALEAQIKRHLRRHLKDLGFQKDAAGLLKPPHLDKDTFKSLHIAQKKEKLRNESAFIALHWSKLSRYFANGSDVAPEHIKVRLELIPCDCWQSNLFRLASLLWSVPVSHGYGRRLRYLVWDDHIGKLIGIIALGDPVFNMRVRDSWIGWNIKQREQSLVHVMDAYVLGAVPPYNLLLGGKLIASLIRSEEIRKAFQTKYSKSEGLISKSKKDPQLCLITTTSALGRSSVYNRLKLQGESILIPVGYTSGWGHFHIPDSLFEKMRAYLKQKGDSYANNHKFGDGPNWKLRASRKALSSVGLDPDLMRHGICREVFMCPLANNIHAFLRGETDVLEFKESWTASQIAAFAINRWVSPRSRSTPEFRLFDKTKLLDSLVLDGRVSLHGCTEQIAKQASH